VEEPVTESNDATRLHSDAIVVDGLYHTLLNDPPPGGDHIQQLIGAGVTAVNLTIIDDVYPTGTIRDALARIYDHLVLFDVHPELLVHVLRAEDLARAKRDGKLGIIFGTQGSAQLEHDIRWATILHRLGVRILQITYNEHTAAGSGCLEPRDDGLTRFGAQLIGELNRLGVTVDVSHVGLRTSLDAIAASAEAVVFSHSGVKALVDNPRNLTDEQIKAAAATGGLVGLCPHSIMCSRDGSRPTVGNYIDQIQYVAGLVGIDHVGIGTDRFMTDTLYYRTLRTTFERSVRGFFGGFDVTEKHVEGFNRLGEWPNLTAELLRRGFGPADVMKVLGQNWLRVFTKTWKDGEIPVAPPPDAALALSGS
jgi:membrane dipeptidase